MSTKSQHKNMLLAILGLVFVVAIVGIIGFFTLGKQKDIIQGEVECRVHQALQWLNYDELSSLDHCPGDEALIARLMKERPGYRG